MIAFVVAATVILGFATIAIPASFLEPRLGPLWRLLGMSDDAP